MSVAIASQGVGQSVETEHLYEWKKR